MPGSAGGAGAAVAAGAKGLSSPPITATATAVACFLRPIRTSRSLERPDWDPSPPPGREGVNAHG
ncbi:hypothetical protein GCM10010498_36060 [Streptomyces cavourensis]|nr:hypothetical protein GCM10010498_36060 [Streptomyces cavourensis]